MRLGIDRSEAVSLMTEANWLIEILALALRIFVVVLARHNVELLVERTLLSLLEVSLNRVALNWHRSLEVEACVGLVKLVVGDAVARGLVEILQGISSPAHAGPLVEEGLVVDAGSLVVARLRQVPRLVPSLHLGGAWQVNTISRCQKTYQLTLPGIDSFFFNYICMLNFLFNNFQCN